MEEPIPSGMIVRETLADTRQQTPLANRLRSAGYQDWVYDQIHTEREALMALPTHEDGIQLSRLYAFGDAVGMPHTPIRFVSEPPSTVRVEKGGGGYRSRYDIAFVVRDPEIEELNGPEASESVGFHELTHSWWKPDLCKPPSSLRQTIARIKKSELSIYIHDRMFPPFWEEAFAEYMRGQYVVHALNKPEGFGGGGQVSNMPDDPRVAKYTIRERLADGHIRTVAFNRPYAYGALMLEELFTRSPELKDLFYKARTDQKLIPDIETSMNTIVPNLWGSLFHFYPTFQGAGDVTARAWKQFFEQPTM